MLPPWGTTGADKLLYLGCGFRKHDRLCCAGVAATPVDQKRRHVLLRGQYMSIADDAAQRIDRAHDSSSARRAAIFSGRR